MRISELSRRSGVSAATIKYYLREGLLHDGRLTSATQAQYDENHVSRLRLIRALIGVGGLSVAATRNVLDQLNNPPTSMHSLFGDITRRLERQDLDDAGMDEASSLIERMGWEIKSTEHASIRRLGTALAALNDAEFTVAESELVGFARVVQNLAEHEITSVSTESRDDAVRDVVLGTVLFEPLLLALRRLALIDASARQFGTD